VTTEIFGSKDGGDLGHQYIIDVLRYWSVVVEDVILKKYGAQFGKA
jgi:hypothetical protein